MSYPYKTMVRFCLLAFLQMSICIFAHAHETADPLQGLWTGTIHKHTFFTMQCHEVDYDTTLQLTLRVSNQAVSGQGTAHLANPVIKRIPCKNNLWNQKADWTAAYISNDLQVSVQGYRPPRDDVMFVQIDPLIPLKVHFTYESQRSHMKENHVLDVTRGEFPDLLIPIIGKTRIGSYSSHKVFTRNDYDTGFVDLTYFAAADELMDGGYNQIEGHFEKADSSPYKSSLAKMLALFLAYLGLWVTGLVMDPSSSKFLSGFGGIVGLAESLGGIGLKQIALQGRLGGFAGSALAESLELARIYQTSTTAGESALSTTGRLGISFGADLASFAAGVAIMEAATGVIATATGFVGAVGAAAVGIGGAAVLTYGVSKAADATKDWANQWLN